MTVRACASRLLPIALLAGLSVSDGKATVFSSEGYGWWWDDGDAAASGRGGTSVAGADYGASGATNPAVIALAEPSYGFISYGGEVASVRGEEGSFRQRADFLPRFGGVIVLPANLRVAGMLRAQTDATYERQRTVEGSDPYVARTVGRGGWNRLQLVVAGSGLDRRIAWGVGLARVQGSVKEEWSFDFEDPDNRDLRQMIDGRLEGGWIGSLGLLIRPIPELAVGGAGSLAGSSRLVQEVEVLEGASYREVRNGRQELPAQWALGLRGSPLRDLYLSADFVRTLWGDAGFRASAGEPESRPYDDTNRWGLGLEYSPGASKRLARTLRAGYQQTASYVRTTEWEKIEERTVSLGFREPLGRGRAALDLALEYGARGDRAKAGVEERFVRITVGIVFSSSVREF